MPEEIIGTPVVTEPTTPTPDPAPSVENQEKLVTLEVKAPVVPEKDGTGVDKQVEKAARKLKLKIDGAESEYTEEEVINMAQQHKASQKRFADAAKTKLETENFFKLLKTDPQAVLSDPRVGVDVKKFAEDFLLKELEKQELSPEARENFELKQKLAAKEKEDGERAEKDEADKQVGMQKEWAGKYEEQIKAALEVSKIPKTSESVARVAKYLSIAIDNDMEITAEQAAAQVHRDYMQDLVSMLGEADGETLLAMLGEGTAKKIRMTDLARLEQKLKEANPDISPQGEESVEGMPTTTVEDAGSKKLNLMEWRAKMEKQRNES